MKSNEIRSSFLKYFADRGHKIVPSAPLIPQDDPTLLFINAGMNQFKNVFIGLEKRDYKTAASSQKCIRAGGKHNDLENVGFTARHHTFFEMLGNFSFGDYFKEEAIAYAWEYLTKTLGLDPSRLYATVYNDDDDAEKLWKKIAPELKDRVLRFGEKDNFWSMGDTGPCGPCSEIHYDRGDKYEGELNGDGDRFMEIWNLVFMQYNRDESGNMTPLPKPSVDTGAGLERFCMILQNGETNYDTDLFTGLLEKVSEISGVEYSEGNKGVSHRVIADHVRALTFAIADGGVISNEGYGDVLKSILKRAARHGRLLDIHEPFLYKVVEPLVELMGGHYPEIKSKQSHIELVLKSEEEQFDRTLDNGLEKFGDIAKKVELSGSKIIPGKDAFELHDTLGFPIDLTEVMAKERGLHVDMNGFLKLMTEQKERSRKASSFRAIIFNAQLPSSEFSYEDEILVSGLNYVEIGDKEAKISLIDTPFYPASGGQVSDTGIISSKDITLEVKDVQKHGDSIIHIVKVIKDKLNLSDNAIPKVKVTAEIDHDRRADIQRNHTATHLLHKALKEVLGDHVNQSGSLVDNKKLRFDFTYPKALTAEEINKVENRVKEKISEKLKMHTPENDDSLKNLTIEKAREMGAMALFGEKYGDIVRVIKTSDNYSIELCGGTHVTNTADIGDFFITQETAIAAGMRRIEAYTGRKLEQFFKEQDDIIEKLHNYLILPVNKYTIEEIEKFRQLTSNVHKRYLLKKKLLENVNKLKKKLDKRIKTIASNFKDEIFREALQNVANSKPLIDKLISEDQKAKMFIENTQSHEELMIYSDLYKNKYYNDIVIVVSGITYDAVITGDIDQNADYPADSLNLLNSLKDESNQIKGGGKSKLARFKYPKSLSKAEIVHSTSNAAAVFKSRYITSKRKKK